MSTRFDHYVVVDWSAANQPKRGRDSIWICHRGPHGESFENLPTRHRAKLHLSNILAEIAASDERVLLGFDFPFGYPAGLAHLLGLAGTPWRVLWDEIAGLLHDGEDNRNDRFVVAADLNRRISNVSFPFWGCPARFEHEFLGPTHHRLHKPGELAEKRLIDRHMTGAQPCWKLAYTGSVGSQALTGIPVVRALRDDPRWADCARIWPFETGLELPDDARIVFAEVWPSWWKVRPEYGPPNDKAQVRTVAEIFSNCDQAGDLRDWFWGDPTLSREQRRIVETEEAWTLGVTAPRQRRVPVKIGRPYAAAAAIPHPSASTGLTVTAATDKVPKPFSYLRDPAAITRKSLAIVRAEANLTRYPPSLRRVAARIAHAAGDVVILDNLAFSPKAARAGKAALEAGAPILVDATMVMAGINRKQLPAANELLCFLRDPAVPEIAAAQSTTRSAAAVELWRPYLVGAVVAIGNAPTALFRLLELLAEGAGKPALILGFPVGFVGAAESKAALAAFSDGIEFITLLGRRGGSAMAAAAVNALASR